MVTRVSTFSQNTILLREILRNEQRLFRDQQQIASGLKTDEYRGIARDIGTLGVSKTTESRLEQFKESNLDMERRLNIYDVTLRSLSDAAQELRQDVINAISLDSGLGLRTKIDLIFDRVVSLLNTKDNGRFIFGGTRTDIPPVNVSNPSQLEDPAVVTSIASIFDNNKIVRQAEIDEDLTIDYGVLASTVATDVLQSLRRLMRYDAGNDPTNAANVPTGETSDGPFANPLTTAQKTFLIAELAAVTAAFDTLNQVTAQNGVNQATLEDTQDRQEKSLTFVRIFISDIEDVNVVEAISRLNLDQLALDASFQVFSRLTRLTLVDFL